MFAESAIMSTDRELIELAAKAAGIIGTWELDQAYIQERWYFNVPYDNQGMLSGFEWNPLRDDGDALRLAVKLRLDICTEDNDPHPIENRQISHVNVWPFDGGVGSSEDLGKDPYAATRRAIVRAAAEIGKSK